MVRAGVVTTMPCRLTRSPSSGDACTTIPRHRRRFSAVTWMG